MVNATSCGVLLLLVAGCGYDVPPTGCAPGWHACRGRCVDNRSTASCGAACSPCEVPAHTATATCDGHTCGVICAPGYRPQGAVCAPALRLLAPLPTATVTTHRPRLRWQLPADADGARVQICRDPRCAVVEQTRVVTGESAQPSDPLAPGVHFWRAYGRTRGSYDDVASPTWEFVVGSRDALVNTSWGAFADVNGDGRADLVVGAPSCRGVVYVYRNEAGELPFSPTMTLSLEEGCGGFGWWLANAGDLDGDGRTDLAVSCANSAAGRVYVYLGGESGPRAAPDVILREPGSTGSGFGRSLAGAGDLNGDGYADLLVGTSGDSAPTTVARLYIYFGGPAGPSDAPSVTLAGPSSSSGFGRAAVGAGDLNGDGYADIAVRQGHRTYIYPGGEAGPSQAPSLALETRGDSLASANDVNADGYADLVVGRNVYLGGVAGVSRAPSFSLDVPGRLDELELAVSGVGDVDGDGYADIAVGDSQVSTQSGAVYLYSGSSLRSNSAPTSLLASPVPYAYFGTAAQGVGDLNLDGYADLVSGAPFANQRGTAYVYFGASGGPAAAPARTVRAPSPPEGGCSFGRSVAVGWFEAVGGGSRRM